MCFLSTLFKGKSQVSGRSVSLAHQIRSACKANTMEGEACKHALTLSRGGRQARLSLFLASADLVHIIPRQRCLCMSLQHGICVFHFPPETGAVVSARPGSLPWPVEVRLRGKESSRFPSEERFIVSIKHTYSSKIRGG